MYRLARILFKVRSCNSDSLFIAIGVLDEQFTILDDGQLELTDLVAFGQIRIKIILAFED